MFCFYTDQVFKDGNGEKDQNYQRSTAGGRASKILT